MWFQSKTKRLEELEGAFWSLKQQVAALETNINSLRGFINQRVRGLSSGSKKGYTSSKEEEEEISEEEAFEQVRKAFDGQIPIELLEKYKNRRNDE